MSQRLSKTPAAAPRAAAHPVRLFDNDLLERCTHTSVTTIISFWLLVAFGAVGVGVGQGRMTGGGVAVVFLSGVVAWTFVEYMLHRFVFHLDRLLPAAGRFCFLLHGCHHADPSDASRDIMPLVGSVPAMCGLAAAAISVLGEAGGLVFFGAFALAYLAYDVTHYGCHQWSLPGRIGTYLKRHHLLHHHLDDTRHFGVTSPLWDWCFRTLRPRRNGGGPRGKQAVSLP